MNPQRITQNSNIFIWSDQPIFRAGLKQVLELKLNKQIFDIDTYNELENLLKEQEEHSLKILLVDYETIEGRNYLLSNLKSYHNVTIIALSQKDLEDNVLSLMDEYEIDVYLHKSIEVDKLICVLQTIEDPKVIYFHTPLTNSKLEASKQSADKLKEYEKNSQRPEGLLTNKEWEILEAITQGYSNQQIADNFGISKNTVINHVAKILQKLQVKDRVNAAIMAIKKGWVKID